MTDGPAKNCPSIRFGTKCIMAFWNCMCVAGNDILSSHLGVLEYAINTHRLNHH